MSGAATDTPWLVAPARDDATLPVLVCLPWAGGSAASFRTWEDGLAAHAAVHRVRYPGRESRFGEELVTDMASLADAVTQACLPLTAERPTVLFGHSMGGALAYEVALRLERTAGPAELAVVSGHPAPGHYRSRGVADRDDDGLVAELDRLAGEPGPLSTTPELREVLLPAVRADFTLIEAYDGSRSGLLTTPLAVFRGADDPDVDAAGAEGWRERCAGGVLTAHHTFDGGHFYLDRHASEVWAALARLLAPVGAGRRRPW